MRLSGQSDLIEIDADLRRSTERAYLLFNGAREAWVPRSMVEDNGDGTWTMPRWLAEEKGLV